VDRVEVVVVVESHTDNALFLGLFISLLSSGPRTLETRFPLFLSVKREPNIYPTAKLSTSWALPPIFSLMSAPKWPLIIAVL
jgi:hypothetical protein